MKIVIDLNEINNASLTPSFVYHSLYTEYWNKLRRTYHCDFWGLANSCDYAARELYSHNIGRKSNVKNLILTYSDAEECFNLFKQFADVWAENYNK